MDPWLHPGGLINQVGGLIPVSPLPHAALTIFIVSEKIFFLDSQRGGALRAQEEGDFLFISSLDPSEMGKFLFFKQKRTFMKEQRRGRERAAMNECDDAVIGWILAVSHLHSGKKNPMPAPPVCLL